MVAFIPAIYPIAISARVSYPREVAGPRRSDLIFFSVSRAKFAILSGGGLFIGGGRLRCGGLSIGGGGRSIGVEFEDPGRGYLCGDNDLFDNDLFMFLFIKKSNRLATQGFHIFSIF